MTGLVVVSHSRALAEAAVELASEMLHGTDVRIAVAAGLDETTLGTDAVAIAEAVTAADDGDGVVVLMDLGSAVLSAELALELVDPEILGRVVLCPAALVEGLVVAAVAAAGGASPAEVAAEALDSLAAKQSQLGGPASATDAAADRPEPEASRCSAVVQVRNAHGLHARPAARLVAEARRHDARILLRNLDTASEAVAATSLSRVATLGVLCGHRLEVSAAGDAAEEALAAVVALAERDFDESPAPGPAATPGRSAGGGPMPGSPGIAIGPAVPLRTADVEVPDELPGEETTEWRRVDQALATVRREVQRVRAAAAREVGEDQARIFDAHLMLLDDPDLLDDVRGRIRTGLAAPRAWVDAVAAVEAGLAAVPDPYLRARAADVHAVGQQVTGALVGVSAQPVVGDGVLVADDLTPAQVAGLDPSRISGLLLASASPTGHSVILARSRAIPAVVCAGPEVLSIASGMTVAIDGAAGTVSVDPDPATVTALRERDRVARTEAATALAAATAPARTDDGVAVLVAANVGSVADAHAAIAHGADLAGLVRTEFLYLDRERAPTPAEQVETYRAIAGAFGGRRLTLRTLDVGGDKPLAYAPQPAEHNPFLGMRGIRLALAQHDLLHDQLAAIVTVAHETPVSVMFPMVSTLAELTEVRRRLDLAIETEGRGRPEGLQVGIMVEVPAAALRARVFAPHLDFFSIGTNDLTQYALAAERGNPATAALGDPLDPGVLHLVDAVCRAAQDRCLVAVCGEVAADERATALLVGLGVRELSVAPSAVPGVKQAVRGIARGQDRGLVDRCLAADGPEQVRRLLG